MGKKILIIEDDQRGRKMLTDYLIAHGYEVDWATNGVDGVKLARDFDPDLVVCDVLLPRMSGFEVCFELKRHHHQQRDVPVLLMSAILEGAAEQKYAADLHADGMFVKPFKLKTMLARIEQLLAS